MRLLQTVDDVAAAAAAEKEQHTGDALPVELLRSFDRATTSTVPFNRGGPGCPGNRHRTHHVTAGRRNARARLIRGPEPLQRQPLLNA